MKRSCLFLLFCWIGVGFADFYFLKGTKLADQYWLPVVLGLLFSLVIANLHGILMALQQKRATGRSPSQYRDGELIGASGIIQAQGQPLVSPFSGEKAVIVEYEARRTYVGEEKSNSVCEVRGMMMVPCSVSTMQGSLRLVGFPLMAQLTDKSVTNEDAYFRAAQYFAKAQFKQLSNNPLELINELAAVLNDDDGLVQADFKNASISFDDDDVPELDENADDPDVYDDEDRALIADEKRWLDRLQTQREKNAFRVLTRNHYELKEKIIPQGAEVTVFGTFRSAASTIDIGGGLKNLNHQIHLGSAAKVVASQIRKSFFAFTFFAIVAVLAHYYAAQVAGIDLPGAEHLPKLPVSSN